MKNTSELRAFLVEQMQAVSTGEVSSDTAKAVAYLSQQIYNTINIEVKLAVSKAKLNGQTLDAVPFN